MSELTSQPKVGAKENPIFIKNQEQLKTLKDGNYYSFYCTCGKFTSKGFKKVKNPIWENYLLCKKCLSNKTKIEKYGSLEEANRVSQENLKKAILEKYGVENISQLSDIKQKKKETLIEHYGSLEEAKKVNYENGKKTKKEKYGDENFNNREKAEKTFLEKYGNKSYLGSEKCLEETKKIVKEKYNVENVSQLEWVQEKKEYTSTLHYGVRHFSQTEEMRQKLSECGKNKERFEKAKETNIEKYGSLDSFYKDRYEKCKQAVNEKYGVDNISQLECVKEQVKKTTYERYGVKSLGFALLEPSNYRFKYKNINFDSSWELAYFIWLEDNNIPFNYHNLKPIEYLDSNNIKHKYYPDFEINGSLFEIKGEQFFTNDLPIDWRGRNWTEKFNCMKENKVTILRFSEIQPILLYIKEKYGDNYLKSFKSK